MQSHLKSKPIDYSGLFVWDYSIIWIQDPYGIIWDTIPQYIIHCLDYKLYTKLDTEYSHCMDPIYMSLVVGEYIC